MNSLVLFKRTENLEYKPDRAEKIGNLALGMWGRVFIVESASGCTDRMTFRLTLYPTSHKVVTVAVSLLLFPIACLLLAVGYISISCSQSHRHMFKLYTERQVAFQTQLEKWYKTEQATAMRCPGPLVDELRQVYARILHNFETCDPSLNLSHLASTTVPSAISQLMHLRELNLSHMPKVRDLLNEYESLENLHTLYLSHTGITEIPNVIYKLKNLDTLVLSISDLHPFLQGINKITNLRILNITDSFCADDTATGLPLALQKKAHITSQVEEWIENSPPARKLARMHAADQIAQLLTPLREL